MGAASIKSVYSRSAATTGAVLEALFQVKGSSIDIDKSFALSSSRVPLFDLEARQTPSHHQCRGIIVSFLPASSLSSVRQSADQ
jgi:hypothetical protein